jgi:hypothetical protein
MTLEQRIKPFTTLGKRLQEVSEDELITVIEKAKSENPWFTEANIRLSLRGICNFLDESSLHTWLSGYAFTESQPKQVAVVMAGNIPLVGFHDFLCVVISGNAALVKLSSKDSVLIKYVANLLLAIEPAFETKITFTERLKDFDAVIATGSDNSSRYFDYYFGKYPHIIRRNRTSCAILTGDETETEFQKLGDDVFTYYGLGCRNVAKLFVPEGYNFSPLLDSWEIFKEIGNHHKYCNNYDYQKSIMLVNGVQFLDNGFVMLTASEKVVSPISVIYHEYYSSTEDLQRKIAVVEGKLQCIVGKSTPATVPFGRAQYPQLWDYADGVDTMAFLCGLREM